MPVEELRAFSEVFGRIKSDYVEPVSDKKLITEAINGMLSGLDPHSAYMDAEGFKELKSVRKASLADWALRSVWKTAWLKSFRRLKTPPLPLPA